MAWTRPEKGTPAIHIEAWLQSPDFASAQHPHSSVEILTLAAQYRPLENV